MSKIYTASRLSSGNKVFPSKVEINDHGVTITIPGLFNDQSADVSYEQLLAVKVDTPLVGFSRIYFNILGRGNVSANGFTKEEVTEMRDMIQRYKSAAHRGHFGHTPTQSVIVTPSITASSPEESDEVKMRRMELESEKLKHEAAERDRVEKSDQEFIEGVKKYWKLWVPALVILIAFFVFSNKSKESRTEEAVAYNLKLEQLNDSIQIMLNEHQDRDVILAKIRKLVHPSHEQYEGKGGLLSTEYYDEYWNKVREKRKKEVLDQKDNPLLPSITPSSKYQTKNHSQDVSSTNETEEMVTPLHSEAEETFSEQADNAVLNEESANP